MSTFLLGRVEVHIEQDHRVSEALAGAGVQQQRGVMRTRAGVQLFVRPALIFRARVRREAALFGLQRTARVGVRQDRQHFPRAGLGHVHDHPAQVQVRQLLALALR